MAVAMLAPAPEPRFVPVTVDGDRTLLDSDTGRIAEHGKVWTEDDADFVARSLNTHPGYAVCWDWVEPPAGAKVA